MGPFMRLALWKSQPTDLALDPVWLRIGAYWYPRGGIPIDVFWQSGSAPDGLDAGSRMCPIIVAGGKPRDVCQRGNEILNRPIDFGQETP